MGDCCMKVRIHPLKGDQQSLMLTEMFEFVLELKALRQVLHVYPEAIVVVSTGIDVE